VERAPIIVQLVVPIGGIARMFGYGGTASVTT
jgi:hypothetical protein